MAELLGDGADQADGHGSVSSRRRARVLRGLPPRSYRRHMRRSATSGRVGALDHQLDRHRPPDHRRARPRCGARAVCAARLQLDPARPACRLGHGQLLHHVRARLSRASGDRRRRPVHQRARPVPGGRARALLALALGSRDAAATHAAWVAAGLAPDAAQALGRLLEARGRSVELRFRNVMLPRTSTGGLGLFACEHLTPEPMRRPAWLAHPNGAQAIRSCTIAVSDVGPAGRARCADCSARPPSPTPTMWWPRIPATA